MPPERPRLVLFDIDGTLLLDDGAARDAFAIALRGVYQHDKPLAPYDFSGRTDPQISYMVLRDAGFNDDAIERDLQALWTRYVVELQKRATPDRVRVLAGVREVLSLLAEDDEVHVGLLTGNIEPGARLKLGAVSLNDPFQFGAFGSDAVERESLPPIAVRRAELLFSRAFAPRDVVVIGDSIYDVRCGVPHEATTIAVASGRTSAERLRAESPDFLFESMEDTEAIVAAIRGE